MHNLTLFKALTMITVCAIPQFGNMAHTAKFISCNVLQRPYGINCKTRTNCCRYPNC